MNPVIVYHANCLDGFAAAFVAWNHYGNNAFYTPAHYGNEEDIATIMQLADPGRDIYILDFSFPLDVLKKFEANFNFVTMLDHHKTAFEMFGVTPEPDTVHYDSTDLHTYSLCNNKAGCMLAWEYFNGSKPAPFYVQHIDDRDRWQFKIHGTKEFNAALWDVPRNFLDWSIAFEDGPEPLYSAGRALLRAQASHVEACVKRAGDVYINSILGAVVNTDKDISEVGHALCKIKGTFGLIWYIDSTGRANCSLRSDGDFDVSALAKLYGGGGHKNAAGFKLDLPDLFALLIG